MADRPPDGDTGVRPTADRPPSTPRWVKVFGIIGIVVILLVVILLVTGRGGPGGHGPGQHTGGGDTPPIEQAAQPDGPDDHTPPIEHGER
jgi:hypothetical protein